MSFAYSHQYKPRNIKRKTITEGPFNNFNFLSDEENKTVNNSIKDLAKHYKYDPEFRAKCHEDYDFLINILCQNLDDESCSFIKTMVIDGGMEIAIYEDTADMIGFILPYLTDMEVQDEELRISVVTGGKKSCLGSGSSIFIVGTFFTVCGPSCLSTATTLGTASSDDPINHDGENQSN